MDLVNARVTVITCILCLLVNNLLIIYQGDVQLDYKQSSSLNRI